MSKLSIVLVTVCSLALGFLAANQLVASLAITPNTDRTFLVKQISQSLRPQTQATLIKQNKTYLERQRLLETNLKQTHLKTQSIIDYIKPLEKEVMLYRDTFNQKVKVQQEERLQLYIDIVNKYRDYHKALSSLESFIPLHESDSLLSLPSVQLDLVYNAGGALAQTHNHFIEEPRDSVFASRYETALRQFLAQYSLNVSLVECHATLCAVHLGQFWDEPYYQGYQEIWDRLSQQTWMDLTKVGEAHQYRGKGHQVQVWYLGATQ